MLMQELRLVAVSEDGYYAVLSVPGRSGRFLLPIDDRLRIVARGQFSRLAQYEIEVENPLRPKEIQDRIRAGETAEEIADAAGIPLERVRRFEGPVLAERAYRAQEAQGATVRRQGETGPGPRLGDVVLERMRDVGANPEEAEWDSRKRSDGSWQVHVKFTAGDQEQVGEFLFDPRRRHVSPSDDVAARLCLPEEELPWPAAPPRGSATVTPIASRLGAAQSAAEQMTAPAARPEPATVPPQPGPPAGEDGRGRQPAAAEGQSPQRARPARKAAGGRSRRSSVPSWDEIMFGTSRQPD
jgi:hypothetical protein